MPDPVLAGDPVAARLAEIRERNERPLGPDVGALPIVNDAVRRLMDTAADVPALLAAAEAALELHVQIPDSPVWCRECRHSFPCQTRRKVSAALLGEDSTDA